MPHNLRRIGRALLSVSDKTGLIELAQALTRRNVVLLSTGGTHKALAQAGFAVTEVADVTGFPEIMDGRVKTLHPRIHGGLLAARENPEHSAAMLAHGIEPIDLLISNLYPFEQTLVRGASFEDCIENIDIGGPAMIRAASKNFDGVTVVVDPSDYATLIAELDAHGGATTYELRRRLSAKAYARTSSYDAAIANWLAGALFRGQYPGALTDRKDSGITRRVRGRSRPSRREIVHGAEYPACEVQGPSPPRPHHI